MKELTEWDVKYALEAIERAQNALRLATREIRVDHTPRAGMALDEASQSISAALSWIGYGD